MKTLKPVSLFLLFALITAGCDFVRSTDKDKTQESCTADVSFVNNSSDTIWYLYIAPADSDSWGNDQLKSSTISPGNTFTITNIPAPGTYDFRVYRYSDYASLYDRYLDCSGYSWNITDSAAWYSSKDSVPFLKSGENPARDGAGSSFREF